MSHYHNHNQQQQQGLAPLNPNAVSGNSMMMYNTNNSNSGIMNMSPIMPCSSSTTNQSQDNINNSSSTNHGDASINSVDTNKTVSSIVSSGGTHYPNSNANANRQVRRRKYTHNPYAASSSAASSRASSVASADNSAPSTPMNSSFSDGNMLLQQHNLNQHNNMNMNMNNNQQLTSGNNMIAAVAAAGGYSSQHQQQNNNNNNNNIQQQQQDLMLNMMSSYGNQQNNNNSTFGFPAGHHHQHNNNNMNMNQGNRGNNNNNNNRRNNNNNNMMNMNMNNNNMQQHSSNDMMMNMNMNMNSTNANNNLAASSASSSVHSLKAATEQFDSMRGSLLANSCNARGRHVVVAMIRLQQPEYNEILFDELSQGWGQLVSDMNGCHVARTFVESFPSEKIQKLAEVLSREVVLHMCSASQYSRRVLQTMFETHSSAPYLQAIVDHVASGAVALATTQQGCISVMRVLEFSKPDQRAKLMSVLTPHLAALAADPYGNYVLQTITQALGSNEQVCDTLEKAFEGSWVALSCNKFASNVMEKIIKISAETSATCTARKTIIEELVNNNSHLSIIIVDNFGNFVLQAIIDSCNSVSEFKKIGDRIRPLLASSPYGHKIEGKLKSKRFNNSQSGSSRSSSQDSGY